MLLGDGSGVGAGECLTLEQGAGEEQATGEPVGLLLIGVTGEEGVAADLLNFVDVVAECRRSANSPSGV